MRLRNTGKPQSTGRARRGGGRGGDRGARRVVRPRARCAREPAARSGWRRGFPVAATRFSHGWSSTGSGRLISAPGLSRHRAIWVSTAACRRIPSCSTGWPPKIVARGLSLKAIHRLIVTSAAYRQSSRLDASGHARDANDRLLWRKAPTRLEAEMVRDAMLSAAGVLNRSPGGPSFRDQDVVKAPGTPAVLYAAVDPRTPGLDRRTVFRAWARGGRSPLLDAFDCPDPSTTAPRRAVTTTPLQALSLMNNALVLYLADAFAARLAREAGPDSGRQVDRAYQIAFGRDPEADRACDGQSCGRALRGGHAGACDLQQQ